MFVALMLRMWIFDLPQSTGVIRILNVVELETVFASPKLAVLVIRTSITARLLGIADWRTTEREQNAKSMNGRRGVEEQLDIDCILGVARCEL